MKLTISNVLNFLTATKFKFTRRAFGRRPTTQPMLFMQQQLEATGRAVMSVAVKQVESCFIRALMEDYERWALNPNDPRRHQMNGKD